MKVNQTRLPSKQANTTIVVPLYTPYYFRYIKGMMQALNVEFYEHGGMVWHKDDIAMFLEAV